MTPAIHIGSTKDSAAWDAARNFGHQRDEDTEIPDIFQSSGGLVDLRAGASA